MSSYDKQFRDLNDQWAKRGVRAYGDFTVKPAVWIIGAILALAVLVLAGWQIGWWFTTQNAKRQGGIENINAHNIRKNFGFQQNLRDDITKNVGNVFTITAQMAATSGAEKQALGAQRKAIVQIVCQDGSQVAGDPLPASEQGFVTTNCVDGNVSPSSPYFGAP